MRSFYKFSALLLSFLMLFGAFSCSQEGDITSIKTENSSAQLTEGEFIPSEEYSLVCSGIYRNNPEFINSLNYLKEALKSVYGIKAFITIDDSTQKRKCEIVVGNTARDVSKLLSKDLSIDQFAYSIESEECIAINGGSLGSVCKGIEYFCSEVLGYTKGEDENPEFQKKVLRSGTAFVSDRAEYGYESYTVNGIPIENFKIAVDHGKDIDYAELLVSGLGAYTGRAPAVIDKADMDPSDAVICIGSFDRGWNKKIPAGISGYSIQFYNRDGYVTVGIDASSRNDYKLAVTALIKAIAPSNESDSAESVFPIDAITKIKYETNSEYTHLWTLKDEKEKILSVGVVYREFVYEDENQDPYHAYVLIIDPEYNDIYMGSSEDEYEYVSTKRQNVLQHMTAAASNGFDVVAGVNADFFAIAGDYHPTGIAIKEGRLISKGAATPYFGFTKDGDAIIGDNSYDADYESLRTAVGGSSILVRNSFPMSFDMTNAFNYGGHPRTLAGITADGKLILAVIDGRQPNFSNGASLEQCALFMMSLGAYDAINLDGGGSSCMILSENGEYTTVNKGSDGGLRRVYNSLLVIKR